MLISTHRSLGEVCDLPVALVPVVIVSVSSRLAVGRLAVCCCCLLCGGRSSVVGSLASAVCGGSDHFVCFETSVLHREGLRTHIEEEGI